AVWMWNTGVYPTEIAVGWFRTTICAVKSAATVGGAFDGPMTSPLFMSFLSTPLRLKPTLSPGIASASSWWCISIFLTSPFTPAGMTMTLSFGLSFPLSTLPTGTVPWPVIVNTSWIGRRSALSVGFGGILNVSMTSISVGPVYHGMSGDFF